MQIVKQKSQMNDNLSLTYYFAQRGIPIIPNLRTGDDELIDEFLQSIPKNTNVAIGTHGFIKTKAEKYEWYLFLNKVIDVLNPKNIIVYGPLKSKIFDSLKQKTNFVFYESWLSKDLKMRSKNGN